MTHAIYDRTLFAFHLNLPEAIARALIVCKAISENSLAKGPRTKSVRWQGDLILLYISFVQSPLAPMHTIVWSFFVGSGNTVNACHCCRWSEWAISVASKLSSELGINYTHPLRNPWTHNVHVRCFARTRKSLCVLKLQLNNGTRTCETPCCHCWTV